MKCDKCGFIPNPGDQVCINCGAKLSLNNVVMPDLEKVEEIIEKKDNKLYIILISGAILLLIIIIFLIVKFFILKG